MNSAPFKPTLKNKFGITDLNSLNEIEVGYTALRLRELAQVPLPGDYDFTHLRNIHRYIFQDVYSWAGKKRNVEITKGERLLDGESVDYTGYRSIRLHAGKVLSRLNRINWPKMSREAQIREFAKCFANLWRAHPFRDGNTRTVVTFCLQFAEQHGMRMDRDYFKIHSRDVHDSLVLANHPRKPDHTQLMNHLRAALQKADEEAILQDLLRGRYDISSQPCVDRAGS